MPREVPVNWKLRNVVLILRKSKEDLSNFSPVSLTSVLGKIRERVVLGFLEKHLRDNAFFDHSQHGFLRGKSWSTNSISLYDKVIHLVDQGKRADVGGFISAKISILPLTLSFWMCPAQF